MPMFCCYGYVLNCTTPRCLVFPGGAGSAQPGLRQERVCGDGGGCAVQGGGGHAEEQPALSTQGPRVLSRVCVPGPLHVICPARHHLQVG
jgi:hypothetical protein